MSLVAPPWRAMSCACDSSAGVQPTRRHLTLSRKLLSSSSSAGAAVQANRRAAWGEAERGRVKLSSPLGCPVCLSVLPLILICASVWFKCAP